MQKQKITPVTLHAGEPSVPRPLFLCEPEGLFRLSPSEEEQTVALLVHTKSGQFVKSFGYSQILVLPVQARSPEGKLLWSQTGLPLLTFRPTGELVQESIRFSQYFRRRRAEGPGFTLDDAAYEIFLLQISIEPNLRWRRAGIYERLTRDSVQRINNLAASLDFYRRLERQASPQDQWRLRRYLPDSLSGPGFPIPGEEKTLSRILEEELQREEIRALTNQSTALEERRQALELIDLTRNVIGYSIFARLQSIKSSVELARYAQSKSQNSMIVVCWENIYPLHYANHPQEIVEFVNQCRRAAGHAADHIGITLDIGHLNLWYQYWQGSKENFDSWMIEQLQYVLASGLVKNIHLSENDGYSDTHLALSSGRIPWKKILKILEQQYTGPIVLETQSAGGDFQKGIAESWKFIGEVPDRIQNYYERSDRTSGHDFEPWSGLPLE